MTLYKHRQVLLLLLFIYLLPSSTSAQLSNCNIFLKGNYVEIGINVNGAYGSSSNAPAGYHSNGPSTEYNPCTGTCPTTNIGFVADPDKDGWNVGTPHYFGDYFLPGFPQEGWSIMSRGVQANAWNGGGQCGAVTSYPYSTPSLSGANTSYTSAGNVRTAVWQGGYDSLTIVQTTGLDTSKVFFTIYVTLINKAHTARNNLYYLRTVDPDNDEPEAGSGGFITSNSIDYSLPNNLGATLVSASSTTYSRCYLGLGTLDCRAKAFIDRDFIGLEPSVGTLDSMYGKYGGKGDTVNYKYSGRDTADVGMSIVYKLGTLSAGDSLNFAYAYILKQSDILLAFQSTGTKWNYNGVPHNSGDTINVCRNAGGLPFNITQSGPYANWVWSSTSNDIISPATGTSVLVTLDTESFTRIRAIGTSACGYDTLIMYVKAPPPIKVDSVPAICINGTTTLHAHNKTSYSWSPATGLSCTNCANPVASPTVTTIYKVTGTDSLGCLDSTNVTVAVNSLIINAGTDTAICTGGSIALSATGATTYTWSPAVGLSCTNCANPTASPTVTTTYFVTGTSALGCVGYDTLTIGVHPLPIVNAGVDTTICFGGSVALSASGATTYVWSPAVGLSCTNCANPTASPTVTTTYIVTGTSSFGCIGYDTVVINVHPQPVVNAGADTAICSGGSVALAASGAASYSWSPAVGLSCINCANPVASPTGTTTYIVTGTSPFGCVGYDTVMVSVHPQPIVNAGADTPICSGGSVALAAIGTTTYSWSPAAGLSCNNCANTTASPTVTTTYFVTGTSAFGCIGYDTVVVGVHPQPIINAGVDTTICFGSNVSLAATGANTYSWSPAVGLSCTNCANPTASPTVTTTYFVTGTSVLGCVGYDTVIVTVHPKPVVNAGVDTAVCGGGSVALSATGANTYSWSPATGLSCTSCANPTASPTVTTTYIVTGTSSFGCVSYDTVIVSVHPLPIVNAGTDTAICTGGSVALTATGATTYTWSPAVGLSCTNCANPVASPTVTTNYIVTGTSSFGCVGYDTVVVGVLPKPVVNAGVDTAICFGSSIALSATGATTYIWSPAVGLSCTSCANPTASPTVTTTYFVTGTSSFGCIDYDTVIVTVHPQPIVNAGADTAVCSGGSVALAATGATTYAWSPAVGLSCTNCANPTASPTVTTTYFVTGTSAFGCIGYDTVIVTVYPQPIVNAGADTAICGGGSVALAVTGATTYAWSPAMGLSCTNCANTTASPTVTTTYFVTGTSAFGCIGYDTVIISVHPQPIVNAGADTAICIGGSVALAVTGATTYAWSPAMGLSCTNCANTTASPTVTTTYFVTGTSAFGCIGYDTVVISVHPQPIVNAGADIAICSDASVALSASGASTYAWSPAAGLSCTNCANPTASPTVTSTYIVTGTSPFGCIGYDTVIVTVHPQPIVNAGADTAICSGGSVVLAASGANTYAWSPAVGLSCTNCANPVASATITSTYIVTGTSSLGCVGYDTVVVSVHPQPTINAGADTAICSGGSIALAATGATTYSWSPAVWLSCTNCANPTASPTITTTYIVTGTSSFGCVGYDTVVVGVHPQSIVNAGADTAICVGGSVALSATGATTYIWSPAVGLSCTNCANPTASPTITTTYIVTGTSSFGCVGYDTVVVGVHPMPVVNAGADTAICSGGSVALAATGASTYAWSPAVELSCTNCANPTASPTITTTYSVTGTSSFGCMGYDTVVVGVHPLFVSAGNDTSICASNNLVLQASGATTYNWSPAVGLSCTNCANPTASPTITTTYFVTGTSSFGCVGYDTVIVSVHPQPVVNAGIDTAICSGGSVALSATGATTYSWSPAVGLSCTNCANPVASPTVTTTYIVTGTSSFGCVGYDTLTIGVHPLPIVNAGTDTAICTGGSVALSASGATTYTWSPAVGLSCTNCANPVASPAITTTYFVTGTSAFGCIGYDTVVVSVHPQPIVNAGADTAICSGGSVALLAMGATTYAWSPATGLSCTSCANPVASPTVTTTYIVTGTSSFGCVGYDTVIVIVHPQPILNAGFDTAICGGGSVALSASGANTYSWSPAVGLSCTNCANPTASPTVTTTYIVTGTSSFGCMGYDTVVVGVHPLFVSAGNDTSICAGNNVVLQASGATTYNWSPAAGLSCTNCANPTASPTVTTTYIVTGTSSFGCMGYDTVVVGVHPLFVSAGNDTSICAGNNVVLQASGATTYNWSPAAGLSCTNCANPTASPTVTTTYIVTGTSPFGCVGYDTLTIGVHPLPIVNAGTDTAICTGGSVALTATGATTYTWSPAVGLSCSNCANTTASPTVTTTYFVTGTSSFGCVGYDTVVVSVHPQPIVNAGADTAICSGGSVALAATGTNVYSWSPAVGLSCSNCANTTASPTVTTTYFVTGTSSFGCVGYDTVVVSVHPQPIVNAGADTAVCVGGSVALAATGATTYSWSPAVGLSCTNCANPVASPTVTTTYLITGTSAFGCIGYDTVIVTIHPQPIVNAGVDTAICTGGSVALSATGATTYIWSPAVGLSCTNCANPVASPTITSTYFIIGTCSFGCIGYDTVIVSVHPQPIVNAGIDTAVCGGGSIALSATGATTYTWSPAVGLSCTNCANPVASPTVTTTYIVTGTSAFGCIGYDTVLVSVHPQPVVNAGIDTAICSGGSVALSASGATTYSWSPAMGLSCTSCANPTASPTVTTTYFVTGTSSFGCVGYDTIVVGVHPLFVSAENDTSICAGNNVVLQASGATTYNWSPAVGLSCTNCANPTASPTVTTAYFVTGTSSFGCVGYDTVVVSVHPQPIVNAGADTAVCVGGSVALAATGATTYSWSPAVGLSCTNCASPVASPTVTTTYIVTGTSFFGCVDYDTVVVSVHPKPVVNAGADTAICSGGSVALSASGATTYSWSPAVGLSCTNCANTTASPTVTTTYFVTGTSSFGCIGYDTVVVGVHPLFVSAGNDTSICTGNNVVLQASGATTYNWSPAAGLSCTNCANPVASPTVTTSYILSAVNQSGCSANDTIVVTVHPLPAVNAGADTGLCANTFVILSASGATTYSWSPAAGLSCANCAYPVASPATTTIYMLTGLSAFGCVAHDTVLVTVHPKPQVNAGSDTAICVGKSTVLTASGQGIYNWTPSIGLSCTNCAAPVASPTVTTLYTLATVSDFGCINQDSVLLTVHALPVISTNADTTICAGSSLTLKADGAAYYTWSPGAGLSCTNCSTPAVLAATDMRYYVTGTDVYGCIATDSIAIKTIKKNTTYVGNNDTICVGQSVQLTANGGDNYLWIPSEGLTNSNSANPFASPANTTDYSVYIYQGTCFVDTYSVNVIVYPNPTVTLGPDQNVVAGSTIILKAVASNSLFYEWAPVTTECSNCSSINVTVDKTSKYTVIVTGEKGCKDTANVLIQVHCDKSEVFIPNTFTPNNDGVNDVFVVSGNSISLVKVFNVYDRWGELVYSAQDVPPNEIRYGWDGTYKGEKLKSDVYVYYIAATCETGDLLQYKGDISLIR